MINLLIYIFLLFFSFTSSVNACYYVGNNTEAGLGAYQVNKSINKSIDKAVDGMTIDFGDTLPKTNVNINSFDNILKDASLSVKQTSPKKVINYEKGGNAYKDFTSINAVNPQVKNNTFIGKTKDGEIINLHKSTSLNGIETLEVYDNNINKYIDIRYK